MSDQWKRFQQLLEGISVDAGLAYCFRGKIIDDLKALGFKESVFRLTIKTSPNQLWPQELGWLKKRQLEIYRDCEAAYRARWKIIEAIQNEFRSQISYVSDATSENTTIGVVLLSGLVISIGVMEYSLSESRLAK